MAQGPSQRSLDAARAAKSRAKQIFEKVGPVCGVGLTRKRGRYAVKVNLEAAPKRGASVPTAIDGVPVVVEVVGKVRKQPARAAKVG
jgi:hypothetical protein